MKSFARLWAFLFAIGSLLGALTAFTPAWASEASASGPNGSGSVLVSGEKTSLGEVLSSSGSRALYDFSFDAVGTSTSPAVSNCASNTGCTGAWPPLLAPTATGPFVARNGVKLADLGTTTRSDGTFQVTYFGHPLYKFSGDSGAGQINGENVAAYDGIWDLVMVNGQTDAGTAAVSLETTAVGMVLDSPTAFSTFHSLYVLTADSSNRSTCVDACATIWAPLLTTHRPLAGPGVTAAKLGTITRADGTKQVTYSGHPLYYFAFDLGAGAPSGQTNGQDLVDSFAFGVWYLMSPVGRPNAGTTTVGSETTPFPIIAYDSSNASTPGPFTLYAFSADTSTTSACNGACAITWPPLLTSAPPVAASGSGVTPSGLGTITRSDGTLQVTYFGHPLYLFAQSFTGTSGEGITAFGGTFQVVSTSGSPR